jgi:phosphoglycolate phosphatase
MTALRVVLFDIDGTLLELHPAVNRVFVEVFEEHGIASVSTDWDSYLSGSDPALVREILRTQGGRSGSDEEVARVLDSYLARLGAGIRDGSIPQPPIPGGLEALRALESRSEVRLALATGNARRGAELRLGAVGAWGSFETGAFGEDGDDKTAILAAALERCAEHWPGADAVYVGDHDVDAHAAREAHIPFIRIHGENDYGPEFFAALGL